ncbi:LOW QUALITY PROTEIN: hypothetical protein PanWU01x14_057130 [Parasponia andersonii]|uniref:Uncharacterized protein n=1 Tax=Parasponia andersonii TaxID=3476 RepID=A0A2P5DJR1_PARAD|nr:LOW QUALITY PROTEIN: hypothetical protein PanWU01x14_057130 [Parasponia andersonii]
MMHQKELTAVQKENSVGQKELLTYLVEKIKKLKQVSRKSRVEIGDHSESRPSHDNKILGNITPKQANVLRTNLRDDRINILFLRMMARWVALFPEL